MCRSSGPVSYGYSELENNNQSSMAGTMCGDMALQTPGVEYSSTSIKREIVVSRDKEILQTAVISILVIVHCYLNKFLTLLSVHVLQNDLLIYFLSVLCH